MPDERGKARSIFILLFWIRQVVLGLPSVVLGIDLLSKGQAQGIINVIGSLLAWIGGSFGLCCRNSRATSRRLLAEYCKSMATGLMPSSLKPAMSRSHFAGATCADDSTIFRSIRRHRPRPKH